jgi:hypothetical protein
LFREGVLSKHGRKETQDNSPTRQKPGEGGDVRVNPFDEEITPDPP